ncbi:MAG: DUF362 domain-containing protein, partial [Thermoguttaceae bacterium]
MLKFSRRDFLVHSAAAGMLACQADRLLAAGAAATSAAPSLTIARWKGPQPAAGSDAEISRIAAKLTRQAIEGLGGMKRFVRRGDVVWIKANIGWDRTPELAGNTNPDVVATLVKMCFDAGAKTVKVGDNSVHAAAKTYQSSGIAAAVLAVGGKVVFLDKNRYKDTAIGGERVKSLLLYPEILDCDLVINVPIVKHHVLSNATLAMKNYMGVMDNRAPFHQDFAACLSDLTRYMKPRLCVLDAVRVLIDHGPVGGNPADVKLKTTVAAGSDIVALEALGLDLLGRSAADTKKARSIIKYAVEAGLGKPDYRAVAKEIAVA